MPSLYQKHGKWYARLKGDKVPGRWSDVSTGETDREKAERFAAAAQKTIDKRRGVRRADAKTLREWVETWLTRREESGHDWKKDRGRLTKHVLPVFGDAELSDVTTARIAELVHALRFRAKLANRTARNVYSVLAAVMRDARIAGLIQQTPCVLTEAQLGSVTDKDPEWRASALFTREEAQAMVSDPRIPLDRQLVYAFGVLAGMRIGEGAALRWRNYDATREPLGCLTVARAYSTSRSEAKGTKTEAVRHVPVHPVLAEMLAEWRAIGWAEMFGRDPQPDDLIVPLPPDVKRTKRKGDPYRGWDYTGRRWREIDLAALGWRSRSVYDTRATFITLALEDGANPDIIEQRVTHTKQRRSAFSGYDRGERWAETCREVGKLRIVRLAAVCCRDENPRREPSLRRRVSNGQSDPPELQVIQGGREVRLSACDHAMAAMAASVRP
jgi:integrase